jgi:hypothetical protein
VTATTGGTFGKPAGEGWITFAMIVLGIAGLFNIIDGIVALSKSSFYVANAHYVFSDLHTWGWIVLILGIVQVLVAAYLASGSELARWLGVGIAAVNAIAQLMFLPAYRFWSLAAFTMDVLVVYGLTVYGGARLRRS